MSKATIGRAREYDARDALIEHGWVPIMRAAASKGSADLLMAHPVHGPALIQVGTDGKSLLPAERARFLGDAALCRALPIVARKAKRKPFTYHLVTDATPRHWPPWDPTTGVVATFLEAA